LEQAEYEYEHEYDEILFSASYSSSCSYSYSVFSGGLLPLLRFLSHRFDIHPPLVASA
jgi:hypothetical protein